MSPAPSVLIGLRASPFRDEMVGWVRGQGFDPFVTQVGREAAAWLQRGPGVSFLDRDLERVDGEEVWRMVRSTGDGRGVGRLVLMAEHRTKELWLTALGCGVATVLPLPAERDAVLYALRIAGRA